MKRNYYLFDAGTAKWPAYILLPSPTGNLWLSEAEVRAYQVKQGLWQRIRAELASG